MYYISALGAPSVNTRAKTTKLHSSIKKIMPQPKSSFSIKICVKLWLSCGFDNLHALIFKKTRLSFGLRLEFTGVYCSRGPNIFPHQPNSLPQSLPGKNCPVKLSEKLSWLNLVKGRFKDVKVSRVL